MPLIVHLLKLLLRRLLLGIPDTEVLLVLFIKLPGCVLVSDRLSIRQIDTLEPCVHRGVLLLEACNFPVQHALLCLGLRVPRADFPVTLYGDEHFKELDLWTFSVPCVW